MKAIWSKKDYPKQKNGYKVYSCFACGGGSTMGYKLAGYEVIGANDIDPQMAEIYQKNHNPKYYHLMDIRSLVKEKNLQKVRYINAKRVGKKLLQLPASILYGSLALKSQGSR